MKKNTVSAILTASMLSSACLGAMTVQAEDIPVSPLAVAVGEAYDWTFSEEFDLPVCRVSYPALYLMYGCELAFSDLSKTLDDVNQYHLNNGNIAKDNLTAFVGDALQYYTAEEWTPYSCDETLSVRRADTHAISLVFTTEAYDGAFDTRKSYWAENYDSATGNLIFLSDVVTDMDALQAAVNDALMTGYPDVPYYSETVVSDYFANMDQIDIPWSLDYTGLTFYFNVNALSDLVDYAQVVSVPFADYPELFNPYYMETSPDYCATLDCDVPYYYDLDSDGVQDFLYIAGDRDEYGTFSNQIIDINGEDAVFDTYSFEMTPTFVHLADGRNYLYIENQLESDYREIAVYDLNNGTASYVDTVAAHTLAYPEFEEYVTRDIITEVNYMHLESRSNICGTLGATRTYYPDENGVPVSAESLYHLLPASPYTLLKDLEAEMIDAQSYESLGTMNLYAGAVLYPYSTDMESFMDFYMEDGTVCRISIDISGWPQLVNGMNVEEVFDGIIYAG
ncbi:MAG: hypothetical protein KBT01_08830 [Clostridiales bacterium]|nr:hypothetical protein [Candidatus Blautia equi]